MAFQFPSLKKLYLLLISLLLFTLSKAESNRYTLYNVKNGLNRSHIDAIAKDAWGFIWLGTEKGLIRFDGRHFLEVDLGDPQINSLPIAQIEIRKNQLFIQFRAGGLLAVNLHNYQHQFITRLNVVDFDFTNDTTLAILLQSGEIILKQGSKTIATHKHVVRGNSQIVFYNHKLILSTAHSKLDVLNAENLRVEKVLNLIPFGFNDKFGIVNGKLLLLTNFEIFEIDQHFETRRSQYFSESDAKEITAFKQLNDTTTLFIKKSKLVYSQTPSNVIFYKIIPEANLECNILFSYDPDDILIGTNQGLLIITSDFNRNTTIDDNLNPEEQGIRVRRSITEMPDGGLILAGFPFQYLYKDGHFKNLMPTAHSTIDVLTDNKFLYCGTEGGGVLKVYLKDGSFVRFLRYESENGGHYYDLEWTGNDSCIFTGGQSHIYKIDREGKILGTWKLPSDYPRVRKLLVDSITHNLWVGTNKGIFCLNSNMEVVKFNGKYSIFPDQKVNDLLLTHDRKHLYAACNEGVLMIDPSTGKKIKQLSSYYFENPNSVSLEEDRFGRVWIGTYFGLVAYDPQEDSYVRLGIKSTLFNTEFNYQSSLKLKNGNLIFGGLNGYDIIKPEDYQFNSLKGLALVSGYHSFRLKDTIFYPSSFLKSQVEFNIDSEYLRFYLSTADAPHATNFDFEYRLDEGPWISAPEGYVDIHHLNPGSYRLQFRAFNEFGTQIEIAPVQIKAITPFYKSRLFIVALLAISILSLILYLYIIYKSNRNLQELRKRVSMDLHDEVGTILTRTLYLYRSEKIAIKSTAFETNLKEALFALRVYIKTLEGGQHTLEQLTDELKDFLNNTFDRNKYQLHCKCEFNHNETINTELYRDIKLCFYEMCTNILKHSSGTAVWINMYSEKDFIYITIKDSGERIDENQLHNKGYGLDNIEKRVKRNSGDFKISSNSDEGGLLLELKFKYK